MLLRWVGFSVGQALAAPGGGSMSTTLAEWARDHYLGPVVTFGEWLTYSPPKVGGKPGFSLAARRSDLPAKKYKATRGFQPNIPERLSSPAGHPLPGEGVWRVLETVKGEPAIFGTFLRPDPVHTSYVAGIVSMDQRRSASSCGQAPRIRARVTGRPRRGSRRARARACWPRSTAGSS